MFVFDPIKQGLEFLACRDLENAENIFLAVINDPYSQQDELSNARSYLNDIRACQSGTTSLDFNRYKKLSRKQSCSLGVIDDLFVEIYFSHAQKYSEFDKLLEKNIPKAINQLNRVKIGDIAARDKLFSQIEKNGFR